MPGLSDGITSPPIWVVSAAASRTMPAASIRLNRAQPSVEPVSRHHRRDEGVGARLERGGGLVEQGTARIGPGLPPRLGRLAGRFGRAPGILDAGRGRTGDDLAGDRAYPVEEAPRCGFDRFAADRH